MKKITLYSLRYSRCLILVTFVFLLFSSCHKSIRFRSHYFAFGISASECDKNCAVFFLVLNGDVYPDDMERYDMGKPKTEKLKFKRNSLGDEKYKLAKKLMDNFPEYMESNPNQTYGEPDTRDFGAFHIFKKESGKLKSWHMDGDISKLPPDIQAYVTEMKQTIIDLDKK